MSTTTSLRPRALLAALSLLLLPAIGCGSDAVGPDPAVASVIVTGAPLSTMLVGDSARLAATAVNESGGVIANQSFTWTSSSSDVAIVRSNGTVLATGAGTATITASAGTHSTPVTIDIAFGTTVATQGTTLGILNGAFNLVVPSGGVAQPTLVLIRPTSTAPADPRIVPGTGFTLGPDAIAFQRPWTLSLKYDAAKIPAGLVAQSLQLYVLSGTAWALVPYSTVDLTTGTVTGAIYRAGTYVVRSTPVDRIVLAGSSAGIGMYAGQTTRISARLLSATSDSLPTRPLTWTSSDVSKVTIDGNGNVLGVAAGTATVKAATDGKEASIVVTVLARPTADWSRATDWGTYQGDMRHTGHVDATVDPGTFHERWAVTQPDAAYFQPTVGGGSVYLATNTYFGAQRLLGIDPATGRVSWTRDFGSIFGINQATYDSGTLYMTSGGHSDTYMWAVNATNGSLRFQKPFDSQWEHWKAPVIVGAEVVTAGNYYGGMYGFDRTTGTQAFVLAGPQVDGWAPAAANGLVYTTGWVGGGGVRAIDPATGTTAWDMVDSRLNGVLTPVIGDANDLLAILGGRIISTDLTAKSVTWEASGGYTGIPVVGNSVIYAYSSGTVTARRESDGTVLWTWAVPSTSPGAVPAFALTNNVLFVSVAGTTYAVDLPSHLAVWSYPLGGDVAIGADGTLYIVQAGKVASIALK